MASARILDTDHELLRDLSKRTGKQYQEIVHEALDMYRRDHLLDEINVAFERLKADPKAWAEETAERLVWDGTLADSQADE
jgi:hypothetical protein